jgi:hypothetical protein
MLILTLWRTIRATFREAYALQQEMERRFPHLRE